MAARRKMRRAVPKRGPAPAGLCRPRDRNRLPRRSAPAPGDRPNGVAVDWAGGGAHCSVGICEPFSADVVGPSFDHDCILRPGCRSNRLKLLQIGPYSSSRRPGCQRPFAPASAAARGGCRGGSYRRKQQDAACADTCGRCARGGLCRRPAGVSQDVTLEFVVWNYSLETIQDNIAKFEAENPGIKVNVTDYAWPDYNDSLVLRIRQYADRCHLRRSGLVAGLGRRRLHRAARERRAGGGRGRARRRHRGLRADRRDLRRQSLWPALLFGHTISFIYNKKILEDHGIPVPTTWGGDRCRREAQGGRHG